VVMRKVIGLNHPLVRPGKLGNFEITMATILEHTRWLMLLSLSLLLTGCSWFGSKDNTQSPAPLVEFSPTVSLKTLWTANVKGGANQNDFKLVLSVADHEVFTASPKGYVTAYDFRNGHSLWQTALDVTIAGGPGVGEGLVIVGSNHGDVIALSTTDGKLQWQVKVSSEILAVPQISQGIVVVRTIDGKLFGLASQTGQRLWVYERNVPLLTLRGTSTPLITDDHLIVGLDNGKLALLELRTGKLLWEMTVAVAHGRTELERMADIDADPKVAEQIIYATSYQGRTIAADLSHGQLLWERDIASYAGLDIDADKVYVSDSQSQLWALQRDTGATIWKQDKLQARGLTAPVIFNNYVIVGDNEGYVHWLRREDGQFVTRYNAGDSILVPPLVIEDTILIYTRGGELIALQMES